MYNLSVPGFFRMLNPFMHSKMDFKQQKIMISCIFMSADSGKKSRFVENLNNALSCIVTDHKSFEIN
jgi:hypothetical protein